MFSNNLLDNISDMVVTAERKGNTFVVTDVSKGESEESSTELLKKNSRTAEMIVVSDRNGNTIVVKDIVVPSTNNENEKGRCNSNNNNNEEDIDDDGSNSTVTTLSTIISAVKSLSLSSSNSTNQLLQSPKQSPKQQRRRRRQNRITIATLMTGRRGRKLLYLFKIKSNSSDRSLRNEEKNVSTDDLDRLLHSSLSTTSSFDSYKCLGKTI